MAFPGSKVFAGLGRLSGRLRSAFGGGGGGGGTTYIRAYQAGKVDRTDLDFSPIIVGPNLLADQTLGLLQRRSQWMVDNDPLIGGAVDTLERKVVGTGIYPIPTTPWDDLNERLEDLWWRFSEAVNAERSRSYGEDQKLFLRNLVGGGECLVHRTVAPPIGKHRQGPATELIHSARLALTLNYAISGSRTVRQAIEVDELGRRVGYHVLPSHPADGVNGLMSAFSVPGMPGSTVRIDVADADLAMCKWRQIGQLRGVPAMVLAIQMARYRGHVDVAFLELLKAMACMGIFFTGVKPGQKILGEQELAEAGAIDGNGNPITSMEPGMVGYLPGDAELKVVSGNVPPPAYEAMQKSVARLIGAGIGMSYGALTKDRSATSFSSARVEQLDDGEMVKSIQEDSIWARHTRPSYRALVEYAIASGEIQLTAEQRAAWLIDTRTLLQCEAMMTGTDWVNPAQEAAAEDISLRNSTNSVPSICAKHGRHWKDVLEQQIKFEKARVAAYKAANLPLPTPGIPPTDPQRPVSTRPPQPGDPNGPTKDDSADPESEPSDANGRGVAAEPGWVGGVVGAAVAASIAAEDSNAA